VIKIDGDGHVVQYEKDGKTIVSHMTLSDQLLINKAFSNYWPYAQGMVDTCVKNAAETAFMEAWGYYRRAFSFRLRKLERKHHDLTICHSCGSPRFKSEYCPSNGPGCDI